MARSTYVYVVMSLFEPIAGFTVRHELVTWLHQRNRSYGYTTIAFRDLRVVRLPDGGRASTTRQPTEMSIPELLGES